MGFFLNQFLEPMLTLIAKEEITDEEYLKCQQIIYNLIAFQARHEPLTLPVGQHRCVYCIFLYLTLDLYSMQFNLQTERK